MTGNIPAIITPDELKKLLGIKSHDTLLKLPIPKCRLFSGSSKYIFLASDVLEYLRNQRDITEIDLELDD